ncbi:MAG: imidazole glycerol phosphate synthase subunit HisH [Clostridiales bacterium]|nr:imidazole glycerol phosphate synthase subunit HisH [Clostridiales bacterium]
MPGFTAIIDYGIGNLHSVSKALDYIGIKNRICGTAREIKAADALILPGVGAFPDGMAALEKAGLVETIKSQSEIKPLLGICLGMQLLFDKSHELVESAGLGLIPGTVGLINTGLKLPQIGWNSLAIKKENPLTRGLDDDSYVYFVHSYCASPENPEHIGATCDYGAEVCAITMRGNLFGCQFHPEKSGDVGLQILKNFAELYR